MTKRDRKRNPPASAATDVGTEQQKLEPPVPLLPNLEADQQKLEIAVESSLADFLAIVKTLRSYPKRLLLILFEYRWTIPLLGERELLTQAIQAMERASEMREQGYSVKDLDALEELWWLVGGDRKQRRDNVVAQRQKEITKKAVDGSRLKGNRTRELVIAIAIDLKTRYPRLTKKAAAERIAGLGIAPCRFDQARNILKEPFEGDPWK